MSKHLILIAGPTASGKTSLAIHLAQELGSEIISADARQVFREMKIGTAMPTELELAAVPHHLVGHRSVTEPYDASDYGAEAEMTATRLFTRYDNLILCGGSGLYIKAFLEGLDTIPEVPDAIRKSLTDEYLEKGMEWLRQNVLEADPSWYQTADTSNPRRLIRALEVYRASGKPLSSFQSGTKKSHPFSVVKIGLDVPRDVLGGRIDRRVDQMVEAGLFEEAESLYPHLQLPALQTVGYREIFNYMDGQCDRKEAIALIRLHTRQYAKRQMTWFRKDEDINWHDPARPEAILSHLRERIT
ncbi:MAG: tRNA (adenosine(37)-N6)-dimethylallyltransferase MiaA [Bacteroidota bacterium]